MRDYWSCSKFADALRGTPKPEAASSAGWREWKEIAKTAHPVRFWLAEEALDKIQDFVRYPLDRLYDIKYYILNRWVTKTHALTSNLKRGGYYEVDTRIMHCLFDELVNFVEIEKAWLRVVWHDDAGEKYKVPGYAIGPFRTRTWRCPEAGIDYLNWEATDPVTRDTPQGECARTTLELYYWWKNVYNKRQDPMDASGWSEYCARDRDILDDTHEDREKVDFMLSEIDRIEKEYDREDEEMLIKLIKIRKSLWT